MKKLMLGLVFALVVAVSIGVLSAGAVTSNKAVSVNLNEFNVLPGGAGRPGREGDLHREELRQDRARVRRAEDIAVGGRA